MILVLCRVHRPGTVPGALFAQARADYQNDSPEQRQGVQPHAGIDFRRTDRRGREAERGHGSNKQSQ